MPQYERRVVDNRVFLLGLDKLYRDAMKEHERTELLSCARRVAEALQASPSKVPVEGYYAEDEQLTEYFRLLRALQEIDQERSSAVSTLPELQRLWEVTSAPLYGRPQHSSKLLPSGRDALSQALEGTFPEWTVTRLTVAAFAIAQQTDDISLVGLAALAQDTVVLTALRESVVLYAAVALGAPLEPSQPQYLWEVDEHLARQAGRFVETFNRLFREELPAPRQENAKRYWWAYDANEILGRCVRLGYYPAASPVRHYHWAIYRGADGAYAVQEFWSPEVWTTTRYRSAVLRAPGRGFQG